MNKKILSVAALSGLVVSGVLLAAGMGQPGGGGGQPGGGAGGQPPARGPGGEGGGGGRQPGGPGGRQGGGGQSVEGAMKGMDRAIEALKGSIADASKKDDNLRLIGDAERACVGAKNAKPTDAINAAKDDAAKAAVVAAYRKHLLEVLKTLIVAEEATTDGKTAEAKAAIDKVITIRDSAHKEFKVKEKEQGEKEGAPSGRGRGGQNEK